MPALKMKTKTSVVCSREGSGLGVCQKSSKISKSSCSQVRVLPQAEDVQSSIESNQDVPSQNEASSSKSESDEAVDHDVFDGEICQCQSSLLSGFSSPDIMEFLPDTCSSDFQTIFSPISEPIEYQGKENFPNNAAVESSHADVAHSKADDDEDNGSHSSSDNETCNISDFHISDMIVASLPFDGSEEFNDVIDFDPFPNHDCLNHDVIFDMSGRYMILPFLEETGEVSNTQNDGVDDSDPQLFLRSAAELSDMVPAFCPMLLPKETRKRKLVSLVLDLDETLVHSTLDQCINADFTFPVFFNMKEHTVYVKRRPYLQTFLERVAEMFEIIIFTASQSTYAEKLLNILDPESKFFSRRAYRESCIFSDGTYTKDLTVLGVDLSKVAIIDNSPQVFRLQVNNGIPIKSWFDDPSDSALISLLPFLETLVDADDVRPIIAKRFSNKE